MNNWSEKGKIFSPIQPGPSLDCPPVDPFLLPCSSSTPALCNHPKFTTGSVRGRCHPVGRRCELLNATILFLDGENATCARNTQPQACCTAAERGAAPKTKTKASLCSVHVALKFAFDGSRVGARACSVRVCVRVCVCVCVRV